MKTNYSGNVESWPSVHDIGRMVGLQIKRGRLATLKLYHHHTSVCAAKTRLALAEKGLA